jgi:hypothetical protein
MKAMVEKRPDYRKGYPYLVLVSKDLWGWHIDSWHKTKREATATARDIEALPSDTETND